MKCGDPLNPGGVGHKANGDPCKSDVVVGTFRCHLHSGKSPMAEWKAKEAMALLRLPAVDVMYHAMQALDQVIDQLTASTCGACGFPLGDVEQKEALIKACVGAAKTCQSVLDRTGIGPRSTLEIKQGDGDLDLSALTMDEKSRMIAVLTELKALKQEVRQRVLEGRSGNPIVTANTPETIM